MWLGDGGTAAQRRSGPHRPSRWWSGPHDPCGVEAAEWRAGALAASGGALGRRRACGSWEDAGCRRRIDWGGVVLSGSR